MARLNPFRREIDGFPDAQVVAVSDRVALVRQFDREQCRDALELPDLQKTVETAVRRRLRRLERES